MTAAKPRREDTAAGCRSLAEDDLGRAAAVPDAHMRECLERSAGAWAARARLLDRLEASFAERAATVAEAAEAAEGAAHAPGTDA